MGYYSRENVAEEQKFSIRDSNNSSSSRGDAFCSILSERCSLALFVESVIGSVTALSVNDLCNLFDVVDEERARERASAVDSCHACIPAV